MNANLLESKNDNKAVQIRQEKNIKASSEFLFLISNSTSYFYIIFILCKALQFLGRNFNNITLSLYLEHEKRNDETVYLEEERLRIRREESKNKRSHKGTKKQKKHRRNRRRKTNGRLFVIINFDVF